ncbi:MAG: bifunctional DNA-formamidopyrimidine glycosylase/DNA-(apurinic or apyrimidinic site) lyase [Planctomycetaceae bacterium]
MPELPEVETMVRGIRPHCEGRRIAALLFPPCSRKPISISPDRPAISALAGHTLVRVGRLGKRVILELDNHCALVVEPRMTGLLLVTDPPTAEHLRVVWELGPAPQPSLATRLMFWDRRGLGTLSLLNSAEFAALRDRLGPDALDITPTEWRTRLAKTSRPVKVALLDQTIAAGIGNLYASEILHLAGISPKRPANSLSPQRITRLHESVLHVLQQAIRYEGSTLNDGTYRNALNQDGSFQNHHRVYDRENLPCATCGAAPVRRIVQAQRSTFYCPACQR